MNTQAQQTQTPVMDAIITDFRHNSIFHTFGSKEDLRVVIVSKPYLKSTSLFVNKQEVGESIKNITWAQLEKLQQEAFEKWLSLQN